MMQKTTLFFPTFLVCILLSSPISAEVNLSNKPEPVSKKFSCCAFFHADRTTTWWIANTCNPPRCIDLSITWSDGQVQNLKMDVYQDNINTGRSRFLTVSNVSEKPCS